MMGASVEKIQVILQAMTKGFHRGMTRAQKNFQRSSRAMSRFNKGLMMSHERFRMMNKVMMMSPGHFMKFAKSLDPRVLGQFGLAVNKQGTFMKTRTKTVMDSTRAQAMFTKGIRGSGRSVANSARMMTHGLRGFRMEMLGVMFFGMMLQRTFLGLLQPAMEAFGVFDLFRLMLLVLFIPTIQMLFPLILGLINYFMNLDDSTKKLIGIFVLIGAAVGTALFIFGTFMLGIGSVILALGSLVPFLILVGAAILLFGQYLASLVVADIIAEKIEWLKAKLIELGASEKDVNLLGVAFDTVKETVGSWFDVIKEKILSLKTQLPGWISAAVPGIMASGGQFLMALVEGITAKGPQIKNAVTGLIDNLSSFLNRNVGPVVDFGTDILTNILDGFVKNEKEISDAIGTVLARVGMWIGNNSLKIVLIGMKLAGYIGVGIVKGLLSLGAGLVNALVTSATGGTITARSNTNWGSSSRFNDFIWRPGHAPISISPDDTLVGTKGGAGGGTTNVVNNFNGFTMSDLERALDERDRRLVDDLRRIVKA